jgi:PTS system nitrogen regulatory IIA component
MDYDINLEELIHRGGVFYNVKGNTPEEIYKYMSTQIELPDDVDSEKLYSELCQRETLMSTAVGNGVALPHPRYPLLKNLGDQKIVVCYLEKPIIMNAPDAKPVYVMIMLLTSTTQFHLKVLSQLAFLFQQADFKKEMTKKPGEKELIELIKKTVLQAK